MDNPITKLEFGNVKLLRKNLVVSSATAIVVSQLIEYSEGAIKFIAFTIPENNKPILNKLMWCIVLFYLFALGIRYFDEEFVKWRKKKFKDMELWYQGSGRESGDLLDYDHQKFWRKIKGWDEFRKALILALDVVFPFVLGSFALYYSWSF